MTRPCPQSSSKLNHSAASSNDIRTGAEIIGGEKGTQAFREGLKQLLGEKGFQGLDMGRPLVGYVVLAPKPEDITAVVAFPVTDRSGIPRASATASTRTSSRSMPRTSRSITCRRSIRAYKALMRFKDRYAYIAYGANPTPHIDAKALVPMEKLFDPAERGLVSARLHVERIPLAVKLAAFQLLEEAKKSLFGKGLGKQEEEVLKPVMVELENLSAATSSTRRMSTPSPRGSRSTCRPATSSLRRRSVAN